MLWMLGGLVRVWDTLPGLITNLYRQKLWLCNIQTIPLRCLPVKRQDISIGKSQGRIPKGFTNGTIECIIVQGKHQYRRCLCGLYHDIAVTMAAWSWPTHNILWSLTWLHFGLLLGLRLTKLQVTVNYSIAYPKPRNKRVLLGYCSHFVSLKPSKNPILGCYFRSALLVLASI